MSLSFSMVTRGWQSRFLAWVSWLGLGLISHSHAAPITPERAQALYRSGDAQQAKSLLERDGFYEADPAEALLPVAELFFQAGFYQDAVALARLVADEYADENIEFLGRSREILRQSGFPKESAALLEQINLLAVQRKKAKDTFAAGELVALGKIAAESRVDPVRVLKQFYQPAIKKDPKLRAGYLAAAELSHQNRDFKYATEFLRNGLKKCGTHPDLHYQLALALYESNLMTPALAEVGKALAINPRHIPSLMLNAMRAYGMGTEGELDSALKTVFDLNPHHPRANALLTAQHVRRKRFTQAAQTRTKALQLWPESPQVDYWIGYLLSRRLLLKEAITYLRQATEVDPGFIEAKAQLGLAYLRRGDEKRGWRELTEAQAADPYNVIAFNHAELKTYVDAMVTIETPHFRVRLPKKHHDLYGDRVMELLKRARTEMSGRYDHTPGDATLVEFYLNAQDFSIRLAGIPGGLGVLGACFGDVISMQSAGGIGMFGNNWEHVLWHEYAHTVTLGASDQRVPRWLTEGCSVHEETLFDPRNRRPLGASYQQGFAKGEIIKLSELDKNFRGGNVMLAYLQSGRMVDLIVKKHGYEKLRLILKDLADGDLIESSFEKHLEPIADFEADFTKVIQAEALSLAPDLDWALPPNMALLKRDEGALTDFLKENPNNFWALKQQCLVQSRLKLWDQLEQTSNHLLKLHPTDGSKDCANYYLSLAARFRGDHKSERNYLEAWLPHSTSAVYAYERLSELNMKEQRWTELLQSSQSLFGVQPLTHQPHLGMGRAYEALNKQPLAIKSYEKLLITDLINPAETHYRLGTLKAESKPEAARLHALDAISESPRYKAAHRLLLKLKAECSTCGMQH